MRLPTGAFNGLTPDVTKLDIPLPAPGNVRAASAGVGEVRATWNAVSGMHYQVRWKASNAAAFAREDAAAQTGASYIVTGLTAGLTYEVKVASVPARCRAAKSRSPHGLRPARPPVRRSRPARRKMCG